MMRVNMKIVAAAVGLLVAGAGAVLVEAASNTQAPARQTVTKEIEVPTISPSSPNTQNPLVNPGAIATVGNVKGSSPDEIWGKIIKIHSDFAGRDLEVNQPVYKSESDTNQRNRAISMLMSSHCRWPWLSTSRRRTWAKSRGVIRPCMPQGRACTAETV